MLLLAEIADKMPPIADVWNQSVMYGLLAAMLAFAASLPNRWCGGIVVLLCLWWGMMLTGSDPSFDVLIVRELGADYLWQDSISAFLPALMSFVGWIVGFTVRPRILAELLFRPQVGE